MICTSRICEIPDDASEGHDDSVEGKLISRGRFAAMKKANCWQDLEPSVGRGANCIHSELSSGGARTSSDMWWEKQEEEEPLHSLSSVSVAICSQWKMSCGGCTLIVRQDEIIVA